MIDLAIDESQRKKNIEHCKKRGILLPTFAQMRDPAKIPSAITVSYTHLTLPTNYSV